MSTMEDTRGHMLNKYYKEVHATLLCHQSYTLGLFPRGKSGHARVRDNVYCASALWSLSMAYRHIGDDKGRTHELEQSAVKCMRGILFCYMRQAQKVESFKRSQSWEDALHSRFNCQTGDPVVDHQEWGHLQIDGTSLFLLMLAQMTASDVQVIFTMDEVDFVQNLVYYVERAYRTPDYGMWERGSRDNVGRRELHASSIGMAKAALEAMNGLNLFGSQGSSLSIIHVDPDAHYRNCVILNNLLPRESSSKETDASLLFIVGYPAFAIDNVRICQQTEERTKQLLGPDGRHGTTYGFKRFARDGHHTVKEDPSKKYYDPEELTQYEGIECEWPLFFIIVILTEYCRGNKEEVGRYWKKLDRCLVKQHSTMPDVEDWKLVPRLYFVCESELSDETTMAGSTVTKEFKMEPLEEDIPFLWAQALYLIARLTYDNLLSVTDLDPLGLHLPHHARSTGMARHLGFKAPGHDTIIQVALISETTRLQAILATHGIPTQTQKQVEPIKIRSPGDILMKVFQNIGANKKLGLTGRPSRPIGALGTSKVYRILGQMVVFFPTDFNVDFYISFDVMMLIDLFKSTMSFLNLYWNMCGKPTVCIYLTENRLKGNNFRKFIDFLAQVKHGVVNGIKVRLNSLQALISTSYVENLEVSMDEETDKSLQKRLHNPPRRSQSGSALFSTSSSVSLGSRGGGDDYDVFMVDDTEIQLLTETDPVIEVEPAFSQADLKSYSTDKLMEILSEGVDSNLLGRLYIIHELRRRNEQSRVDTDEMIDEILQDIYEDAGEKKHWKTVRLAAAMLKKVVDSLAPSLTSMLVRGKEVSLGVFGCPEVVISEPMNPKEIVKIIYEKCMPYDPVEAVLQQELLIYLGEYITRQYHSAFNGMLRIRIGWIIQAMKNENSRISYSRERNVHQLAPSEVKELLLRVLLEDDTRKPLNQRQLDGALNRVPADFYVKVFGILKKIRGGISVRDKQLPQIPTIYEMDAHEKSFALKVEELLSTITFPEYRQMIVELLMVVSTVLERNPEVNIKGSINMDELLENAMGLYSEDKSKQKRSSQDHTDDAAENTSYACFKSDSFYGLFPDGPRGSASYIARAVVNKVLQEGLQYDPSKSCSVS